MTKYPDLFAALAAPFEEWETQWFELFDKQKKITRRIFFVAKHCIANRLDTVVGPENWWPTFTVTAKGVYCSITIRIEQADGSTREITKGDSGGSGKADGPSEDRDASTFAFKRAALMWGITRYLKGEGTARYYADDSQVPQDYASVPPAEYRAPASAPAPPAAAAPPRQAAAPAASASGSVQRPGTRRDRNDTPDRRGKSMWGPGSSTGGAPASSPASHAAAAEAPRSGRDLFVWVKDREENFPGMLKYLMSWAAGNGLPERIVDWPPDAVQDGYTELMRKLELKRQKQQYEDSLAN